MSDPESHSTVLRSVPTIAGFRVWTIIKFVIGALIAMLVGLLPSESITWLTQWGEDDQPTTIPAPKRLTRARRKLHVRRLQSR